jgi:hypothetical protein
MCHAQAMVVTELCSGGDLAKAMRRARRTRAFGWYMRGAKIALDVACGLAYLHKQGVSSPPRELLSVKGHCVGFVRGPYMCDYNSTTQEHRRTPVVFPNSSRYTSCTYNAPLLVVRRSQNLLVQYCSGAMVIEPRQSQHICFYL